MTPVYQRLFHNPPHSYGDCHRAAMASLLDLPYERVPHFMDGLDADDDAETFAARESEFLHSLSLARITFPISADLEVALAAALHWNPGRYFLLGCTSKRGHQHTVVCGPKGVEHDPNPLSPGFAGIAGPMSDGFFWITYVVGEP